VTLLNMRLEDQAGDVLKKFRFGRKKSLREIAEESGIESDALRELESGERSPSLSQMISLGKALGFDGRAMEKIHLHPESTPEIPLPFRLLPVKESFDGYAVWCTLARHPEDPRRALLFDTGGGGRILLETIRKESLEIEAVLLTHGHPDHGGGFSGALTNPDTPVLLDEADRFLLPEISDHRGPVLPPGEGCALLRKRGWPVTVTEAPGHTPGSVAYLLDNTLLLGDTIFCGSAGRCFTPDYFLTQLDSIHRLVSGNDPATRIISGHGPFTTIGLERQFNPFVRVREHLLELSLQMD